MSEALYTPAILRLATEMPCAGRLAAPDATAERRSPVCGGRVAVDVAAGPDGRVARLAVQVHACALGQAAATLLARGAIGRSADELAAAHDSLAAWLDGAGELPDWPGVAALAPARPYRMRHAAILLAFAAAAEAAARAATRRRDAA